MVLAPGFRLGPYEITAPLGAGGMGEVYRARDSRLGREIAIKVLPSHLSANPEVRARFEREARAVSSLNHPHICTLHDVGHQDGVDFLVMELVEGETLARRLERGPVATAELLRTAVEVASALDRAHRSGIVHRDLKPGNIMLTKAGAKLMDFGLARATGAAGAGVGSGAGRAPEAGVAGLTESPTMSRPLTTEGAIVGTFQYMAPEQLEGQEADPRTDLWALGCVVYEMATGKKAFEGKSQASLIAAILKEEPRPITELQPLVPPALERVVKRCLAKDPDDRWQSARDLMHELEWIREAGSQAGALAPVMPRRRSRERIAWALAVAALVAAGVFALRSRPPDGELIQLSIPAPVPSALTGNASNAAISPDGRMVAFCTEDSTGAFLWVRPFDADSARRLARVGDIGSRSHVPFWSPDGRKIAYYSSTDGKLKKIAVAGGAPVTICDAEPVRGGTWNRGGVIVFARAVGPLYRVSAGGGDIVPVTALDTTRHETGHRFPQFLPDGEHFLFAALPPGANGVGVFVGSLRSKRVKKVMTAEATPIYAAPGYLLFPRQGSTMAQRFDHRRLQVEGQTVQIAEAPPTSNLLAESVASASRNGRLVVLRLRYPETRLQWFDRSGQARETIPLPAGVWFPSSFSPDGRKLAALYGGKPWVVDLDRAIPTRLAPTELNGGHMVWSPDGSRIAFVTNASGRAEIYLVAADGTGEPEMLLTTASQFKSIADWSPDGRYLVFGDQDSLWLVPMTGDRKPEPYIGGPPESWRARISPDGRWLAYPSSESGQVELYVQPFPKAGQRVRISTDGGTRPVWTRGGKELIYFSKGRWMSVAIEAGKNFRPGVPRTLFAEPRGVGPVAWTKDGERFLASVASEEVHPEMQVLLNWTRLLAR
ncbi:MAG TPA: protein kinase [Candidatus Eisenbacteria bacterium]